MKTVRNINIHKYFISFNLNGDELHDNIFALNKEDAIKQLSQKYNTDLHGSVNSIILSDEDSSISINEGNEPFWVVTCMLTNGINKKILISAVSKEDAQKFAQQLIRKYSQDDSEWVDAEINSIEPKDLLKEKMLMKIRRINEDKIAREQEFADISEDFNLGDLDDTPFVVVSSNSNADTEEKPLQTTAQPITNTAIVSLINSLIVDEFEAIEGYNSAITTISDAAPSSEVIAVLRDIASEENKHVGQLQRLLSLVSEDAHEIHAGYKEADKQIKEVEKPMTQKCDKGDCGELHPVFHSVTDNQQPQIQVIHENPSMNRTPTDDCRQIDNMCTLSYDAIDDNF